MSLLPYRWRGDPMSSGAYALHVDQSAGGGPTGRIHRVVPLPPTNHGGVIDFNDGWLSLAYDDFGAGPAQVDVRVRVITRTGVRFDQTIWFPVGRTVVTQILSGDLAASF